MLERFVAAEMEDEYCALPFNHDAEYAVSLSLLRIHTWLFDDFLAAPLLDTASVP